ncbi:MAG: HAD-IIIC family phosphatase [Sciscionella sp.]
MNSEENPVPETPTLVKCLVWDLDNTLWRGTLLEDGEITLTDEVRSVIVALDARGILQSICSRNDHDHAWARLEELGVAEYFVLPKIGWGRKSEAVHRIADELKFANRAIAFIDDQPAERAEVAFHLPGVRCYPAEQALSLMELPEFSPATVTVDAQRRRQMYQAGFRREAKQTAFTGSPEDFLRTLDLELRVARADPAELSRVTELTLRTSQMNATGVHYGDAALRGLLADPGHEVLTATLTDRFGPHGAIGVLLLATGRDRPVWHLKLLATSCRVVAFGVGTVLLNWLADQAAAAGVHLLADFRPTDRNRMMDIAYRFAGFTDDRCGCADALDVPEQGVQRLHLVPGRRPAPDTLHLIAPDLSSSSVPT